MRLLLRFHVLLLLCSLGFLSACAGVSRTKLSPAGKRVQVMHNQPYSGCEVVGKVIGENDRGSVALARNHARNLAAVKGGNAIIFDEEIVNGQIWRVHATAFQCP